MAKNKFANRYLPEIRAHAARRVCEHQGDFNGQSAAMNSSVPKRVSGPDKRQAFGRCTETDSGGPEGVTTVERDQIKALERQNRQLRQIRERLEKASAYFAPPLTHVNMYLRAAGHHDPYRSLATLIRPFQPHSHALLRNALPCTALSVSFGAAGWSNPVACASNAVFTIVD